MIGDTLAKSYDFDTGILVYSLRQRKIVEVVPLSNHVTFPKSLLFIPKFWSRVWKNWQRVIYLQLVKGYKSWCTQCSQLLACNRYISRLTPIKEKVSILWGLFPQNDEVLLWLLLQKNILYTDETLTKVCLGSASLKKKKSFSYVRIHCFLYLHVLVPKPLPITLKTVCLPSGRSS